ncbi:hypothetical protein V8D89_003817 [Ganoderma adspersum]
MLSVGKHHILRALISRHARAADCRLVCLGEYTGGNDQALPGMLTDAEVKEVATTPGPDEDEKCDVHRKAGEKIDPLYSLEFDMITALGPVDWYRPKLEYPEGPNVLCNMSKGEYVREDTLVAWETGWGCTTLAHALLSRICLQYSSTGGISMYCGREFVNGLVKGPWAGDRFRITSADEMPPPKGGKEWKGVTKDSEVNTLLCHLFEL